MTKTLPRNIIWRNREWAITPDGMEYIEEHDPNYFRFTVSQIFEPDFYDTQYELHHFNNDFIYAIFAAMRIHAHHRNHTTPTFFHLTDETLIAFGEFMKSRGDDVPQPAWKPTPQPPNPDVWQKTAKPQQPQPNKAQYKPPKKSIGKKMEEAKKAKSLRNRPRYQA